MLPRLACSGVIRLAATCRRSSLFPHLRRRRSLLRRQLLEGIRLDSPVGQRHHARLIALGERRFADHSERLAAEVAIYEWTVREIEAGGGA
jgi:hypothetical protein